MIMAVLRGDEKMSSLKDVKVPKAWMFGGDPDIVGAFVANASNVDDDAWTAWWISNTLGRDENPRYPSHRNFFDRVIARYGQMIQRSQRPKAKPAGLSLPLHEIVAASEAQRPSHQTEPTQDVGDLQPDVTPPAEPDVKPAQEVPIEPTAPTADEIRATSGPAQERRRRKKADAPTGERAKAKAKVEAEDLKEQEA
jgi:hypothetical protein